MSRCDECGRFYNGPQCPGIQSHPAPPPSVGSIVAARHTVGLGEWAEEVTSPALVLAVSPDKVRVACFLSDTARVVDASHADILPYQNPFREEPDGD